MKTSDFLQHMRRLSVITNSRGSITLAVAIALISLGGAAIYHDVPGKFGALSDSYRRLREGTPTNEDMTAFRDAYNAAAQAGGGLPIPGDANDVLQIALLMGVNTAVDIGSRPIGKGGVSVGKDALCSIAVHPKSGKPGDQISVIAMIPKPFLPKLDYIDGLFGNQSFTSSLGLRGVYNFEFTIPSNVYSSITVLYEGVNSNHKTLCRPQTQVNIEPPDPGDDYVVWYMENVGCWGAPRVYATHRDSYERQEYSCNVPGGGMDCSVEVIKKEMKGEFSSLGTAQSWFCSQITTNWYHYWCNSRGPRVETNNGQLYTLTIPCDLTDVPFKYP